MSTPNVDGLCRDGVKLTQFLTGGPVCSKCVFEGVSILLASISAAQTKRKDREAQEQQSSTRTEKRKSRAAQGHKSTRAERRKSKEIGNNKPCPPPVLPTLAPQPHRVPASSQVACKGKSAHVFR